MRRRGVIAALALVFAAACGSGDGATGDPDATTTPAPPRGESTTPASMTSVSSPTTAAPLTASFRGVTEEVIRVGVLSLDWQALADLGVNLGRGTSDDLYRAALEAINDRGGVHGRMLEFHEQTVFPVGVTEQEAACIALTEDAEIFVLTGATIGDSILCYTEQHETAAVVAGARSEERVERARAPYVTVTGSSAERARAFVAEMEALGILDGATIGVTGAVDVDEATYHTVFDAFVDAGYDPVPGLIGGNQDDLAESANEQAVIYQRMVAEGVDVTVDTTGVPLVMANAIDAGYESEQWLLYALMSGTGLRDANVDLDYIDGAYAVANSLVGTVAQPDLRDDPTVDACLDDLDARTGREVVLDLDAPVNDLSSYLAACSMAAILEQGLRNAGPDLTNESFQAGLEAIGEIDLPGYENSFLGPGHLGATDHLHLVQFDAANGVWELVD